MRQRFMVWSLYLALTPVAWGVTISNGDWVVRFNLPDQDTGFASATPDEYIGRDAMLARVNQLSNGHTGTLATYTFSGNSTCCGFAGPLLEAMENALDRGASLRFIADSNVDTAGLYGSRSLDQLAGRAVNPLVLVEDDSASGIHHNKFGLFDYGAGGRWVLTGSGNFTGGAASLQWNILVEILNDALYAAFAAEADELLAGRFHDHASKSHAHNNAPFALADSWGTNTVRFSPQPSSVVGSDNALTDVMALIDGAQDEIVFALNHITLSEIRDGLVAAADRGVRVTGSMPASSTGSGGISEDVYNHLTTPANYATTNIVHFVPICTDADHTSLDDGTHSDLLHAKYMVIDPLTDTPTLIHGSANFTFSALLSTQNNDENVIFVRHKLLARMFYAHFKRLNGTWQDRDDFWCARAPGSPAPAFQLWLTDTNGFIVQTTQDLTTDWSNTLTTVGGAIGPTAPVAGTTNTPSFYRAVRGP